MEIINLSKCFGRLRVIKKLKELYESTSRGLSLNIGCKETRLGTINADIDPTVHPDIVADVLDMPFRDNSFDLVIFADVIEHLPLGTELKALCEIWRTLKPEGVMILTTPNHVPLYTYLDPAKYIMGHRHYNVEAILGMVMKAHFKIEDVFTAGGVWELIGILWYSFITYPLKRICRSKLNLQYVPNFLTSRIDKEYNSKRKWNGYTIFIITRKRCDRDFY